MFVPVVDKNQKPLMPTIPARAARWIRSGKATPFWRKGVFCVRLNVEPSARNTQNIVVGIDPGSKREAFTAKSASHTYLNVLADAVTWVSEKIEARRDMRRTRRARNTPYRQNRKNRARGSLIPSTKARWQLKLRISRIIASMMPVSGFVVEDIAARTMPGKRRWNVSFSPLMCGKKWFYTELSALGSVSVCKGFDTHKARTDLGLRKSKGKLDESFDAHNVDSWVLANMATGGHASPENKAVLRMIPINLFRRQLHRFQSAPGGMRKRYGGTISAGFKKGSLVKHRKYGLSYIGGSADRGISLNALSDGSRLTRTAKEADIRFLAYSSFRTFNMEAANFSAS